MICPRSCKSSPPIPIKARGRLRSPSSQFARTIEVLGDVADGAHAIDEHVRKITVPARGGAGRLVRVVRELDEAGIAIDDIALRRPTLDDVFLTLTGHAAEIAPAATEEPIAAGPGRKA